LTLLAHQKKKEERTRVSAAIIPYDRRYTVAALKSYTVPLGRRKKKEGKKEIGRLLQRKKSFCEGKSIG